jgi:uncharacterized sulfatase
MSGKRQFVFIMCDTQGANCVGCYGRPELHTPNIDALAASGARFDAAHTVCPLCTPALRYDTGLAWSNQIFPEEG